MMANELLAMSTGALNVVLTGDSPRLVGKIESIEEELL